MLTIGNQVYSFYIYEFVYYLNYLSFIAWNIYVQVLKIYYKNTYNLRVANGNNKELSSRFKI